MFKVPVIEVAPLAVNVKLSRVKVHPLAIVVVPVIFKLAPVVKVFVVPLKCKLPPTVVRTQPEVVAVPDMVKLPETVVTEVIVFTPEPDKTKDWYEIGSIV